MNHICEFITEVQADANGLPVMVYCEAPAVNFKDRWLCPEHYKAAMKSKDGYIYRQGIAGSIKWTFLSDNSVILESDEN
jgi:hypothetical protein